MGFSMFPLKAEQPTVSERSPEKDQLLTEKKKKRNPHKDMIITFLLCLFFGPITVFDPISIIKDW